MNKPLHHSLVLVYSILLLSFCTFIISTSAQQYTTPIESYNEVIQDTLFSNSQQLTTFQYTFVRHTHDTTTKKSTNSHPFSLFPQQIYDLLAHTSLNSFDYASTQGQWDTASWGQDYTGIFTSIDLEGYGMSFYDPSNPFTTATSSTSTAGSTSKLQNQQYSPIHNGYNLHIEPQPHAGKLEYTFTPSSSSLQQQLESKTHQNAIPDTFYSADAPHLSSAHPKDVEAIGNVHTTITQSLSNLFCSALSQIRLDSLNVQKQSQNQTNKNHKTNSSNNNNHHNENANNVISVISLLPVESLCTEHLVSLRKLIPNHSPTPSATTIFHSQYLSFRVSAEFIPTPGTNGIDNNNNGLKMGQIYTTVSLTFVKNISPNDQTHIETTNTATTTREIHEIPSNYNGLDAFINQLLKENDVKNIVVNSKTRQSTPSTLELSAFSRPHKPNSLYLQHQAYIHPKSYKTPHLNNDGNLTKPSTTPSGHSSDTSQYTFGNISHDNIVKIEGIKGGKPGNGGILDRVLDIFNKPLHNDIIAMTNQLFSPKLSSSSKSSNQGEIFQRLKQRDLDNVRVIITANNTITNTNTITVTNVPRWMCLFTENTNTQYKTTQSTSVLTDINVNSCSNWIIGLFDPLFNIDMTKPQFIHPTLPHVIQINSINNNNEAELFTLVIHREAYYQYLYSNTPITFITVYRNGNNNQIDDITSLTQLYSLFSNTIKTTLAYSTIYYTPVFAPNEVIKTVVSSDKKNKDADNNKNANDETINTTILNTNYIMYPSAYTIQFMTPNTGIKLDSPFNAYNNDNNKDNSNKIIPIIDRSRRQYNAYLINSLISTLITNNNVNSFTEKLYLQSTHHLYWNLLSFSPRTALLFSSDVLSFQHNIIAKNKQKSHYSLLHAPCTHPNLLVNAYNNNNVFVINTSIGHHPTQEQFVNNIITFTPRPSKDSLFFCQYNNFIDNIITHNTNDKKITNNNNNNNNSDKYATKYSLLPNIQTSRHFTSMALDSTDFVIDIKYTPQDIKPTQQQQQTEQQRPRLKLIKQTSTITWQVGDIFFDQLQAFGHFNEVGNTFAAINPASLPTSLKTETLSLFESFSSYFIDRSAIKPISGKYMTKSIKFDHNVYRFGNTNSNHNQQQSNGFGSSGSTLSTTPSQSQQCIAFQQLIQYYESQPTLTQSQQDEFDQLLTSIYYSDDVNGALCLHLTVTLGQQRASPTTITTYFMLPHGDNTDNGYREVVLKIPIQKALFRVSESHTDIARGVDIVAGTTEFVLFNVDKHNDKKLQKSSTNNNKITAYTIPTTNTSMLVPYPDASMPFNATAIVAVLIAFGFGSIFNLLYPSNQDYIILTHIGKIQRVVNRFRARNYRNEMAAVINTQTATPIETPQSNSTTTTTTTTATTTHQ